METPEKTGGDGARDQGGRFKPGQSGNPAGKPVGTGSRHRLASLSLPEVRAAADVREASTAVLAAASGGRISLREAREFMKLLDLHRRAIETDELSARVRALETELKEAREWRD